MSKQYGSRPGAYPAWQSSHITTGPHRLAKFCRLTKMKRVLAAFAQIAGAAYPHSLPRPPIRYVALTKSLWAISARSIAVITASNC